ncbi:MAG: FAD-binding oxidoreductase [Chloroflexi bacterium CFX4]|nr:FAD-binding oxidoreductase [Chloroflexi bacterium CFX4]MDL1924548.1 FAD-binding oxidoreductase [Chloroflexi bacterium CFX3]
MSVSVWQADGTQPIREVDVLVIGAGVVGCAAAYFLRQAGRNVVLIEARDIALGASGRNAGFMITGLDVYYHQAIERYGQAMARELWALSTRTVRFWREFAKDGTVPIRECGALLLAESAEEAVDLEQAARALNADGIPVEFHSSDPLGRGYHAAIFQPFDGMVQPVALAQAIFAQSGAELIANNEVYAIRQLAPERVLVESRLYRFQARKVLLCTNAYSALIEPYFVGKVIPTRGQVLATAPLPQPVLETCGYSNYGYMYFRPTFDGRLLLGGARHLFKPQEQDTHDDRTTEAVQVALEAYLHQYFPEVTAPIERRWAGIMGFSCDGLPMVGCLPDKPDVGFAVGFTGHGLSFGAAAAERAVDHLLNGAPIGALDAARLG